jgi:hypothetical protein
MREFVKQLAASLREDEGWKLSDSGLRVINDKLKVELWVGWPRLLTLSLKEPAVINLSLREKLYLYRPVSIALRFARTRRQEYVDARLTEYIITKRLNTEDTN